jgi:hypothetical protein
MVFISDHICLLKRIYNVSGVKDVRARDLMYDIICLDPGMMCLCAQSS